MSAGEPRPVDDSFHRALSARALPDDLVRLHSRWSTIRGSFFAAWACIIGGGLVAAVSRPTGFELGPWASAYLVLVGGVSQLALVVGLSWLAADEPSLRRTWAMTALWNLGTAGTLVGSIGPAFPATVAGGACTAAALVAYIAGVRRVTPEHRAALRAYQGLIIMLLLSTLVGVALAWTRHAQ